MTNSKGVLSTSAAGRLLGRVCKLGLDGGKAGLSPVRHTARLAEDPSNQLRSWTRAEPLHRSGSLQTRPRRNSWDCSVQGRPGPCRPSLPGEQPSLALGARRELRIVDVTGYCAEKRNNLVQPREADEAVYDPGQRGLRTTKQSCNQIGLEQAHQAPVQCANNNEKKRGNVDHSH